MNKGLYQLVYFILKPIYSVIYPMRIDGVENIPDEGGFIVCANHCNARDPFYLSAACIKRQFHFMAKAELYKNKLIRWFLDGLGSFPVDRGHSDLNAMRTALGLLKDGHGLGIFPQGTRSRDNTPTPMLNGVSMIALRSGAPVIPAYIGGPYRLFRKTQVSFGKPVSFEGLMRRMDNDTLTAATGRIEAAIWNLKRSD